MVSESMLLDYIRLQSAQDPRPSGATINTHVATADHTLRNEFPDAPCQIAPGFQQYFLHRRPMGPGGPYGNWPRSVPLHPPIGTMQRWAPSPAIGSRRAAAGVTWPSSC